MSDPPADSAPSEWEPPQPVAEPVVPSPFAHPAAADIAGALIKRFEQLCLSPEPDTGNRWQIGWGMNFLPGGVAVTRNTPPIAEAEAEDMLWARLLEFAQQTDALLGDAPVNDRQRGAIYSFAWNEGEGDLRGSSMLRYLRDGDMALAAEQFPCWVYAGGKTEGGLVTRRKVERAVFTGAITIDQIPTWDPPPP